MAGTTLQFVTTVLLWINSQLIVWPTGTPFTYFIAACNYSSDTNTVSLVDLLPPDSLPAPASYCNHPSIHGM
ncbi:MAG: hypothetical protein IPN13_19770 [Bacteroidetes bacterium]|nr:hypothetical protein [Bacteroidota bacterium]